MSCFWGIAYQAFWKQKCFPIFPDSVCSLIRRCPGQILSGLKVFSELYSQLKCFPIWCLNIKTAFGEILKKNAFLNFFSPYKMSKGIYFLYQHPYRIVIWQSSLKNVFRRFTPRRTRHSILTDYYKPQNDILWLILDGKEKPYAKGSCLLKGGKSNYWSGPKGFRNG